MDTPTPRAGWSPAKRVIFRFVFAYFVFVNLPFPIGVIPFTDPVAAAYNEIWKPVVPWVGTHVLGLAEPVAVPPDDDGSGDTTFAYVQPFCVLALAAVATGAWTALDRRPTSYERLDRWLRVYVRYALAVTMVGYGAYKVIPTQFSAPSLGRLLQPVGDCSPMGMLWTFMGASAPYTIFAGAVELVGGALLLVRRTALLGALVTAGALTNVVMLNMCYDVPVKLYSSQLLLMAIYVIAPDLERLANVLVLNRPAEPADPTPLFVRPRLNLAASALAAVFGLYVVGAALYQAHTAYVTYGGGAPRSPLYGIWSVDDYEVDGVPRPPLVTDETRWRRVVFDRPGAVAVLSMSDARQPYALELDEQASTLVLSKFDDADWKASFAFERPEPDRMTLDGSLDGHRVRATLRLTDPSSFRLTTRGFHWINEVPYNR
jgi:hypothetical protein